VVAREHAAQRAEGSGCCTHITGRMAHGQARCCTARHASQCGQVRTHARRSINEHSPWRRRRVGERANFAVLRCDEASVALRVLAGTTVALISMHPPRRSGVCSAQHRGERQVVRPHQLLRNLTS
jgi:hypothetical protein